ncbi:MAG: glycosyltransferase [Gammaproteobacteria bacterium]|jgi:glycosyltransferase involved in cell wall biosynthesis|nr:glycosyltransferase [Gammaproteobacteria bacterium]HSG97506.1 glycosyltransferase [Woeseiaceae bacterium]
MPGVAIITTSYPDGQPGNEAAGSFVEDFAIELSKSLPVSVVAASSVSSISGDGNLKIRRFSVPRLPLSLLKPHLPWQWPALFETLRAGREALRTCIREDKPDHVFALWVLPSGWWAEVEAGRLGIPYSTWALGSDIWSLGRLPGVRNVLKRVLVSASHRYADGLELCKDVERISNKPCAFLPSTRTLPALRQSGPASRPPYKLAFLGRWHTNKGSDLLMHALQGLNDEDWDRIEEVRIYGGGPLASEMYAAEKALTGGGRPVRIGGYLDKNEAASLIGWADYLIVPSRIESIPVIFSDAMQLGTPVVATPVGDLESLHERFEYGVLADAASESALREAIQRALRMDAAGFADGIRRARVEFDLAAIVGRFLGDIGVAKA